MSSSANFHYLVKFIIVGDSRKFNLIEVSENQTPVFNFVKKSLNQTTMPLSV